MIWVDFKLACLFWLIVCTIPYASEAADVQDLTIFSEDGTDVTEQFFIRGRDDCSSSLNFSDPELSGPSVSKPAFLDADTFESNLDDPQRDRITYGAQFEWHSPSTGRQFLRGFYVQVEGEPSIRLCRLYIFNASRQPLNFTLRTTNLTSSVNDYYFFDVKVFSLPTEAKGQDKSEYARKDVSFFFKVSTDFQYQYPGDWEPYIKYSTSWNHGRKRGSVNVFFAFPPKEKNWKLKVFDVFLFRSSCPKPVPKVRIIRDLDSNDTGASLSFGDLEEDFYRIKVTVFNHDTSAYHTKECICAKAMPSCDTACGSSMTRWFNFGGSSKFRDSPSTVTLPPEACKAWGSLVAPGPDGPSASTTFPATKHPEKTTESQAMTTAVLKVNAGVNGNDDSEEVAIYVPWVMCCAMVFVIGVLGVIYLWRRKRGGGLLKFKLNLSSKTNGAPIDLDKYLKRKVVYVMAVTDRPESCHLVESFCTFLKTHCHCSVINPRDVDLSQICESAWVTSMIQRCDCITFINSKEAAKLIDNYIDNVRIEVDPSHSITYKALQIVFNATLSCKFNIVTFTEDWTKDRLAVLRPKKYLLPKQLPNFARELHNLTESTAEKLANHLLLTLGDMAKNLEWKNVLQAVKKMKTFEKSSVTSSPCTTSESDEKRFTVSSDDVIEVDAESVYSSDLMETESCQQTALDCDIYEVQIATNGEKCQMPDGKASDIHHRESQENDQFLPPDSMEIDNSQCEKERVGSALHGSEFNVVNEIDSILSEDKSKHRYRAGSISPIKVVAPKDTENVVLAKDDSVSHRLAVSNDNLSYWSQDTGYETFNQSHIKNGEESGESFAYPSNDSQEKPITTRAPCKFLAADNINSIQGKLKEDINSECSMPAEITHCKLENKIENYLEEITV